MHTLVVIDMQEEFSAARNKRIQQAVIQEIQRSRAKRWPIVIVEFEESGGTLPIIRRACKGYPRAVTVTKDYDDGSSEVLEALGDITKCRKVRVCGVNTEACVWATVKGLQRQGVKVEVWGPGTDSEDDHEFGLRLFSQMNVPVVGA